MKKLARSASRRSKTPSRFQYDITLHTLTGLRPSNSYYIKWTRGLKIATSKTLVCKRDKSIDFGGEKLSLLVTLYRDNNGPFDGKDSKISVVSLGRREKNEEGKEKEKEKEREKTVAKIHFDLAKFAGVPSATSKRVFKLSEKVSVKTVVEARFLNTNGKGGKGGGGGYASSMISGISGVSSGGSDEVEGGDDDFADLDIDDVPEPVQARKVSSPRSLPKKKSSGLKEIPKGSRSNKSSSASPARKASGGLSIPVSSSSSSSSSRTARKDSSGGGLMGKKSSGGEVQALKDKISRLELEVRNKDDALSSADKASLQLKRRLKDADLEVQTLKRDNSRKDQDSGQLSEAKEKMAALEAEVAHWKSRNEGLEKRVDKLLATSNSTSPSSKDEKLEQVISDLRKEKASMERKILSFQKHAAKVKQTYQDLSVMYNKVREENVDLKNENTSLREEKENLGTTVGSLRERSGDENVTLKRKLETLEAERAEETSRVETLTRSNVRLKSLMDSLKEKLENTEKDYKRVTRENEDLQAELAAERRARDASSKSSDDAAGDSSAKDSVVLESQRDRAQQEVDRLKKDVSSMKEELEELQEDLQFEKNECEKLRKECIDLRAQSGASSGTQKPNNVSVLERQLSTQRREKVDAENTIEELKEEVRQLQRKYSSRMNGASDNSGNGNDEMEEVVQDLVTTKIKLAEAEDEKLQLHFSIKKMKKHEKGIQEKLAEHASSLEVKLGQATAELERYRGMEKRGELPTFNDDDNNSLDSNDDYEPVKR